VLPYLRCSRERSFYPSRADSYFWSPLTLHLVPSSAIPSASSYRNLPTHRSSILDRSALNADAFLSSRLQHNTNLNILSPILVTLGAGGQVTVFTYIPSPRLFLPVTFRSINTFIPEPTVEHFSAHLVVVP